MTIARERALLEKLAELVGFTREDLEAAVKRIADRDLKRIQRREARRMRELHDLEDFEDIDDEEE